MISALAALCLSASAQEPVRWPVVSGMQFAFKGVGLTGLEPVGHLLVSLQSDEAVSVRPDPTHEWMQTLLPAATSPWKTFQLVFTYTEGGTLAKFGGIGLVVRSGHLWFAKHGRLSDIAPLAPSEVNDVQILKHSGSIITYVNGSLKANSIVPTGPLFPLIVGLDGWKGSIIAAASYATELTEDELFANEQGAKNLAKALLKDTPRITVEGELTAMTPVPELERIRPYRSALLAEEYKVLHIVSGRMASVKPGMKIRIFRYGIRAGEKTSVKDAKIGDRTQMLIQPFESDPKFGREFQVDTLDPDITIPLYVDVTPVK